MKRNIILIAAMNIVITLFGCNSNSKEKKENLATQNKTNGSEIIKPSAACYLLENAKDTVSLKIKINKNHVTGNLLYHYFEKDRNTGTIEGEMKGDTLFAKYTFRSEGKESEREVVFLRKGDKLMEGYANIDSTTGKPGFTNHPAIKFDDKFVLEKTDCQ